MTKTKPKGFILQRLNSPIDGKPCVVILTLESANRKTGNMAQVWILREDVNPVAAIASGDDVSICGNCPHRLNPTTGKRTCYVNPGQAPLIVWESFNAGLYPDLFDNEGLMIDEFKKYLAAKRIRWGAYGDPAVIDPQIFHAVNGAAVGHTGYTHQWREPWAQIFRGDLMASCDGMRDYLEASAHGWKCFSVAPKGLEAPGKLCPATVTGSAAQCLSCRLCDGHKVDVWVEAHGRSAAFVK